MKLFILSADAPGRIDSVATRDLYNPMRGSRDLDTCDAVVVPISYYGDFVFNTALRSVKKPIILIDFLEYFGFHSGKTSLFGDDELPVNMKEHTSWHDLNLWVKEIRESGQLKCYFKRELFTDRSSPIVHPIEWPCYINPPALVTKAEFDARPFEVFYSWGYSNAERPRLHGQMLELMAQGKIDVINHWDHIDAKAHETQPKWIAVHSPHTHRRDISEIVRRQYQSKCSVSMPGSGEVCFRSTEAPVGTIKALPPSNRVWSTPWYHGENCLRFNDAQGLYDHLHTREDLHAIYLNCQETLDRYRSGRYVSEYVIPTIQQHL